MVPLSRIVGVSESIAEGDIEVSIDSSGKDEIGVLSHSMNKMITYLKGMAKTAEEIADGDLTGNVIPKSEKDMLGNAFKKCLQG